MNMGHWLKAVDRQTQKRTKPTINAYHY